MADSIHVKLPDGSVKEVPKGTTALDIAKSIGQRLADATLVTVYLTDIADLPKMNALFTETFPNDPPARVTIQVQPQAAERIRIGLIAAR